LALPILQVKLPKCNCYWVTLLQPPRAENANETKCKKKTQSEVLGCGFNFYFFVHISKHSLLVLLVGTSNDVNY